MKAYALTINLVNDPEKIAQYKAYHRDVWPEVQACLRSVGITKMDIFALGRRLFMVLEANDAFEPDRDFDKLVASSPRYKEWQGIMDKLQERVPEARDYEHWARMERIFQLT